MGSSAFNRGYTLKDENYTIISNPSRDCFVADAPRNDSKQAVFRHCEQSEAISYLEQDIENTSTTIKCRATLA